MIQRMREPKWCPRLAAARLVREARAKGGLPEIPLGRLMQRTLSELAAMLRDAEARARAGECGRLFGE